MIVKKRIQSFYKDFLSLKGEPHTIAMGMAIGVFVGVTPTIPFHTVLVIMFAYLFRQNITAAILGSLMISNPVTIPFFYVSQYALGRYILGESPHYFTPAEFSATHILNMGWQIICPLLLGGVIMATFLAVSAYYITHNTVVGIRKKTHDGFRKKSP
jgi:uncharacterized protein (DUF2062 family)